MPSTSQSCILKNIFAIIRNYFKSTITRNDDRAEMMVLSGDSIVQGKERKKSRTGDEIKWKGQKAANSTTD